MSAGDYTITLVVGAWSVTLDKGDAVDPAADAITVDPLNASWSLSGTYPSQPQSETVSFGLYVPDVAVGPTPGQGTRIEVTITTPDHALGGVLPVLDFVGLITEIEGAPFRDGIRFDIVAADYRSQTGEERIGDAPWPAESRINRLQKMIAASNLPITIPTETQNLIDFNGFGADVAARDVDSQPTRTLLDDLLAAAMVWSGTSPAFSVTGWIDGTFRAPARATWFRAILAQSVDGAGNVTFPICWLSGGLPDVDAALPYTVSLSGGQLVRTRKAITPSSSLVCWIPAAAVESEGARWRQDKASNTNRVRVSAPDIVGVDLLHVGSITAEFGDLITANGPNELAVAIDAAQGDYGAVVDLAYALLGTHYDASPRWALDEITIRAEEIASGDQWPRLFNPREHTSAYDQAAGRLILITDVAEKWNLHDRPDYFGRLAGATLNLSDGKIRWTATLAHRLPVGVGKIADPLGSAPLNTSITYAELAAGANPTYAQCGDLTPADLELVEH